MHVTAFRAAPILMVEVNEMTILSGEALVDHNRLLGDHKPPMRPPAGQKRQRQRCPVCGYRMRGDGHADGPHHRAAEARK